MSQTDETKPISQIGKNENEKLNSNSKEQTVATKNTLDNINVRAMPKKFKISSEGQDGKTKAIGAIIMVVGAFVLVASVYLAYIYLIKPAPKKTVIKTPISVEKEQKKPKETEKKEAPVVAEEKKKPISSAPKKDDITATTTTTEDVLVVTEDVIEILDTDNDGLSDKEEAIFESDKSLSDSDGDGYEDLAELGNLYNPAGEGVASENKNIKQYESASYNYSVLRPTKWLKQDVADGSSVIFGAIDGSFIQIISQANDKGEDIKTWYLRQFPEKTVAEGEILEKNSWQGMFHDDNKIFYLTDNSKKYIFVISYVPEPENSMDYYNIFKMMIDSFSIK